MNKILRVNTYCLKALAFLLAGASTTHAWLWGESAEKKEASATKIHIVFDYGSEKKNWIEAATEEFNKNQANKINGRQIEVEARAKGSHELQREILSQDRSIKLPHIASPASSIILNDGDSKFRKKFGRPMYLPINERIESLVISPLVIMMWKPMADALLDHVRKKSGDPLKGIAIADVVELAKDPQGWALTGHPKWGAFKFAFTHPDSSNSGMMTTNLVAFAGLKSKYPEILDTLDVTATHLADKDAIASAMNALNSSVIQYGPSTGTLAKTMYRSGMNYLNAIVAYENLVFEANKNKVGGSPEIVAIYPEEGTFLSDHPIALVNNYEGYTSDDQRAAARKYADYLLSAEIQKLATSAEYGFRPANTSVPVNSELNYHGVNMTDSDAFITLTAPFSTENPGTDFINIVAEAFKASRKPVTVALSIDISGSMKQNGRMQKAIAGALEFVKGLKDADSVILLAFDDKVDNLGKFNIGKDRERLNARISGLDYRGYTSFYDAVEYARAQVLQEISAGKGEKRIYGVVVITDGLDTTSSFTRKYCPRADDSDCIIKNLDRASGDFLKKVKFNIPDGGSGSTNVPIFTIGYDVINATGSEEKGRQLQKALRDVAIETRGDYYDGKAEKSELELLMFRVRTNFN